MVSYTIYHFFLKRCRLEHMPKGNVIIKIHLKMFNVLKVFKQRFDYFLLNDKVAQ